MKIINGDVKYWIRVNELSDILKHHLWKKFRSYYMRLMRTVKEYGAGKVTVCLDKNLKPVSTVMDLC